MSTISYPIFEWLFYMFFMLTFFAAIFLNSIILNILHRKQLNTTTFKLIANQTASEIVFSVLAISRSWFCASFSVNYSPVLSVLCGIIISVNDSTLYVSAFSMLVIAYERYRKLYRPLSSELNTKRWIISIWMSAIGLSLFNNIGRRNILLFSDKIIFSCKVMFPTNAKFFTQGYNYLIIFIVCNIIPLLLTAVLYFLVIKKLRERKLIGNMVTTEKQEKMSKNKRKTVKMLLAIVIWYFLITIPYYVFIFVEIFIQRIDPKTACSRPKMASLQSFLILGFFYLGSLCVNPFIICYFNPDFRQEVCRLFNLEKFMKTKATDELKTIETTSS